MPEIINEEITAPDNKRDQIEYPQSEAELLKSIDEIKSFFKAHFNLGDESYEFYNEAIHTMATTVINLYRENNREQVIFLLNELKKIFEDLKKWVIGERLGKEMLEISEMISEPQRMEKAKEIIDLIKAKIDKIESVETKEEMRLDLEKLSKGIEKAFQKDDIRLQFYYFGELLQLLIVDFDEYKRNSGDRLPEVEDDDIFEE